MRTALSHEHDPEGQILLLRDLLRVQLAAGDEEEAGKTFDIASKLADENALLESSIEIDLTAADYQWRGHPRDKLEALKTYTVAAFKALEVDPAVGGQVVDHVISVLTAPEHRVSAESLKSLEQDLQRWVLEESGGRKDMAKFAAWPTYVARKLLPFADNPKRLAQEATTLLSTESILSWCGPG